MRRSIFSSVALILLALSAQAQKTDMAQVLVHYKFTHVRDTTDRAHPYTENMVLFVGKSASAYKSYDGISAKAQFKKAYAEAAAASPDGQARINRTNAGSATEYYQFPNGKKLFTKDNLMMNSYLIEGPIPQIDWRISSDTANLAGLHCQKATGHFKGRDYTVWFCPDLPVHTGPWELNGLPGVIVDARDAKNEVVFAFDGVEKAVPAPPYTGPADADLPPVLWGLNDDPNVIAPPAKAIKTTQKEFDKLKAAMRKDPNAFGQAMNAANRAEGLKTYDFKAAKRPGGNHGPVINNPIELPEKK